MDKLNPEVDRLMIAKEARRRQFATLPFPEKARSVVRLQRMAAPLLRARGRHVGVWDLEETSIHVENSFLS